MNDIPVEVDYKKYQWEVCGDFKVIAVLLGLHAGYIKYSCYCTCVRGIAAPETPTVLENIGPIDNH
jgi:hypothetical protein